MSRSPATAAAPSGSAMTVGWTAYQYMSDRFTSVLSSVRVSSLSSSIPSCSEEPTPEDA
mgnify:CR=1 FL=1